MTFLFDNNLSPYLVKGLKGFGEDVTHLTKHFPADTPDEKWLEYIGKHGIFLITRDKRIRYRPLELKVLKRYKVGAFFLIGKGMNKWAQIKQIIGVWPKIKEITDKLGGPFAYSVNRSGSRVVRITLG